MFTFNDGQSCFLGKLLLFLPPPFLENPQTATNVQKLEAYLFTKKSLILPCRVFFPQPFPVIFQIGSLKIWVFWSNSLMWLVPFVVNLICGLYLARAFTTSKAFCRSSLCRFWRLLCICIKYCRSDSTPMKIANSSLAIRTCFPQSSSWFQAVGNIWPHFCLEALGFLIAVVSFVLFCISGLRCRLIISLAFYFDFFFKGEMCLCKSTHTHIILVSLGHLLKGRRHTAIVGCT